MADAKKVKDGSYYECTNVKTKQEGLIYHSSTVENLVKKGILKITKEITGNFKPKAAIPIPPL